MADQADGENSGTQITITVKTPKEKHELQINGEGVVKDVRFCLFVCLIFNTRGEKFESHPAVSSFHEWLFKHHMSMLHNE